MASKLGAVMRAGRREEANQGPVSKRADGRKMTDTDAEREGAGSRKVGTMTREQAQALNTPRANAAGPGRLGEMMRPSSILPPVNSREEYDERVAQNERWAMAPETQAALLQFAVSIMQPVGGTGGAADFVGALGRSAGDAFGAASRVREGTIAEEAFLREENREERKLDLDERQFNAQERRLSNEERRLAQQMGLDERKLTLEERKFLLEAKAGTKRKIVVSADSPLNEQFGLNIPEGETMLTEITVDDNGNIENASVSSSVGGSGGIAEEIEGLLDKRDEAIAAGDTATAQIYQNAAIQKSQEFSLSSGETIESPLPGSKTKLPPTGDIPGAIPSEPGNPDSPPAAVPLSPDNASDGLRIKPIPGGKVDRAEQEAEALKSTKRASARQKGVLVGTAIDTMNQLVNDSIAPNLLITGGVGQLSAILPLATDARRFANAMRTVTSNTSFEELKAMRESNENGAALGPVSDKENDLLQSTLAGLDQYSGKEDVMKNLLTVKFIFDPVMKEQVNILNEQANDGLITEEEAVNKYQRMLDEYIYPPELNQPPPLDWTTPPVYLSAEDAELWSKLEPAEKILFFDDNDRRRAMGAQ